MSSARNTLLHGPSQASVLGITENLPAMKDSALYGFPLLEYRLKCLCQLHESSASPFHILISNQDTPESVSHAEQPVNTWANPFYLEL